MVQAASEEVHEKKYQHYFFLKSKVREEASKLHRVYRQLEDYLSNRILFTATRKDMAML